MANNVAINSPVLFPGPYVTVFCWVDIFTVKILDHTLYMSSAIIDGDKLFSKQFHSLQQCMKILTISFALSYSALSNDKNFKHAFESVVVSYRGLNLHFPDC